MNYPSAIIEDRNISKYINEDVFNNLRVNSYKNYIMNKVVYYCSKFLDMEELYNINRTYNFGLIPYYYSQQFINKINKSSNLVEIFNELVNEYIINTYNYRYNTVNIIKVKLLFLSILSVLAGDKDISFDKIDRNLDELEIIQNVIDSYDMTEKSRYKVSVFIKHVFDKVIKTYYTGKYANGFAIQIYIIKKWIEMNNVTKLNITNYKSQLGNYYDTALYCISEPSLSEDIDKYNTRIQNIIYNIIESFANSTFKIPTNNQQILSQIFWKKLYYGNAYIIYIYTSLIIYHPITMKIPSLQDYDDGNGRTSEFLVSKVYEDIINYAIFNYFVNNSYDYTDESWNKWSQVKDVADENIIEYIESKSNNINKESFVSVINVNKFLSYLIDLICPASFHPSVHKHIYKEEENCHFIDDELWRNIYNIYNIDTEYIIVNDGIEIDFSESSDKIMKGLIDWASKFQVIFKPLKNLWNYYYRVNKASNYNKYSITVTSSNDFSVNNFNTGGDFCKNLDLTMSNLYSIFEGEFMLIDFKKYKYMPTIKDLYYRTILQTWLYMNAYIKPIGSINNRLLYNNYILGVINPYLGDSVMCDDKLVTEFAEGIEEMGNYVFNKRL